MKGTAERYAKIILGPCGRLLSGSKSIYRYDNPKNLIVFNANIVHSKYGKIWYGDLDLTVDSLKLKDLARRLGKELYILYESHARFENEAAPKLDYAVAIYSGNTITLKDSKSFYLTKKGIPQQLTDEEYKKKYPLDPEPIVIYKAGDFTKIELPNLSKLKAKKGHSFLEQFEKWFVARHGKEVAVELYKNLWLTPKYYYKLESMEKRAVKKTWPFIRPVKLDQSVAWTMMNAPMMFQNKPNWAKDSFGYVKIKNEE